MVSLYLIYLYFCVCLKKVNEMFRPGSIRKIEVKNFVTYSHAELNPGPKLNMILGPNGTGKSTMVAAIILGLGGNPKIVGRGSRMSEYVKHGCEEAAIHLSLQDENDKKFIKVTREFDTRDRTTWKLNDKKVNLDEVLNFIKKFNIQVSNLCQFLPQDRVQDFAKLNKQDLLKETQLALCRFDLIEKQDYLINSRETHKALLENISNCQKKIQECHDLNSHLEGRVQSFNKKKEYTEKIQHINRKIAWTTYEGIRSQLTEVKKDKSKAQGVYDKYKTEMGPITQEINDSKQKITLVQQNNNKIAQSIRNSESNINTNIERIETINESIRTLNDDMEGKLADIEQWDKEIENASNKLEEMKNLEREMLAKCNESEQFKQTLTMEFSKLSKHQQTIEDTKERIMQMKQDDSLNIRALENESKRLENVKQTRLQHLQRLNPDTYQAVNWVRNNKHLFRGEIFEPIMLELNVLEKRHARFIENVIPLRDRVAFTCIYKDDMNKLIKSLREEKNLSVNVVHSSDTEEHFKPNIPIERLRKYGFYTYMNNLFTAPVPIMNYLCKTYQLHNIPLGDEATDNHYEDVPPQIRQFFSNKYKYNVSISKYSDEKSIRQVEVGSDGSLSFTLDVVKMNQLKGEINELQRKISEYDTQIQDIDKQSLALRDKMNESRTRLKEFQQDKNNAVSVSNRVETLKKKLLEMKEMKKSPEEIRLACKRKGRQLIKSIAGIQDVIKLEVTKLIDFEKNCVLNERKIEEVRKNLAYQENSIAEKKRQSQEAEETLNTIKDRYNEVMEEAKSMLQKSKALSKGFTPADGGFEQFREMYEALPAEIEELNVQRERYQSRIACLNAADDGEMREYEDRLKQIDKLTEDLEKRNTSLNKVTAKMSKCEEEWLGPLKDLLAQISLEFAAAFEKLGYAGEISICTGENDKDFSQYGISVKVTYRSGEPLQELNSSVQSGGERAVATAVYMLSLQKLTPVPFRCVDEINQGMDASNERRIFELIVASCSEDTSPQYFLITPKLIPRLKYSLDMTIHFVHNGPFVVKDKKWGFSQLCNPLKVQHK